MNKIKKNYTLFKGKYYYGLGRRKTAIARVRLYDGNGQLAINSKIIDQSKEGYLEPLILTNSLKKFDISIVANGGGKTGWKDAINLGVSRALVQFDKNLRQILKKHGFLSRDPREIERKKPGLKKARKAPQWQKR
jgi:small subunit ribosomal protein S9